MNPLFRVLPSAPKDARMIAYRHTYTRFAGKYFSSHEEADARREEIVFHLRVSAGLYPWPEKTPLNTKYELVGHFDGYSVWKIMFETRPGFWSTGNLYKPSHIEGKAPAILNVIGHWEEQRLTRNEEADYPCQLANFAKMGFICLVTDMIGKVDSRQISHNYGTNEKEMWLSNGLGIQLWNNIRALDLLCDMPDVDADRIGVTGASGGGSQTLFLSLADSRIKCAAPINMISLEMQGGCQCENAPLLRIDTENAEMCSLIAPRPLFIAGSTGDWTSEQETREYPVIRACYALYGAEDNLEHYYQVADHQYNKKTRHHVYRFFARHLMNKEIEWTEQPLEFDDLLSLTWFKNQGACEGISGDEEFFEAFKKERAASVSAMGKEEKLRLLKRITGFDTLRPVKTSDPTRLCADGLSIEKNVAMSGYGEQIPFMKLTPENWDGKRLCLAVSGEGKNCLEDARIRAMLKDGIAVIGADIFMTGEYENAKDNLYKGDQSINHFTTFNYTFCAFRIRDIMLMWSIALACAPECTLIAFTEAARAAACALPLLKNVKKAALQKDFLALEGDRDCFENFYVPGILLLGGMEGCMALSDCEIEQF